MSGKVFMTLSTFQYPRKPPTCHRSL